MNRPHFQLGEGGVFPLRPQDRTLGEAGGLNTQNPDGTSIERLRRLLRQETELSEAKISELRDRVASGIYLQRSAAEQVASRLMDSSFDLEL